MVILDHLDVVRGGIMKLEKQELLKIVGGINFTSSLISSVYRAASTILEIGRTFGSAIRRMISGNLCSL